MLLTCVFLVLMGIFFTFLRYSFWRTSFSKHFPGKTPGFFNVFGDVPELWKSNDMHQGLMDVLRERMKLFEKEKLFCIWLLYDPLIIFVRAEAIKELLIDAKMVERSWIYDRLQLVLGSGLLTSAGDKWKSRRKLLFPCFHFNILKGFITYFNEGAQRLVTSFQEETTKDFTLIENPIKLCALDIVCETIFGVKINAMENEFKEYIACLNRMEDTFMTSIYTPWYWPSILFRSSKRGKEFIRHVQVMHQVTRNIIREKRRRYLKGETDTSLGKQKALMDMLMQKHFETGELSEEDIREEVDTFMVVGHESTASAIVWALYLIGLYPDVQAKLQDEINRIFGGDVHRHVTEADLQDLKYLDCVLKESNRLYTTVPIYVRKASEDTIICGYTIPKGTSCAVLTYFLHRDEDVFPDPEAFKPERFLPENSANIPKCAYGPFSDGPRKCIGYKFAELEMKVIVSSFLRNFAIESLDGRNKIQPLMKATLQPSVPIRIRIRSRSNKKDL